jgi:hypothetical protein
MNLERLFVPVWNYFRPGRMRQLARELKLSESTTILDVGGAERNWRYLPFRPKVTILNISPEGERQMFPWVFADACALPFPDRCFDVVFSNSAIEHLGSTANQAQMAQEMRRVGRNYYLQTPDFWFPFDVHMLCPVFHWLPKFAQRRLIRYFTPWGYLHRPTREQVETVVSELELLTAKRLKSLFPDGKILHERIMGLSKSLICIGPV